MMNKFNFEHWILIALLLINITLVHGFTALSKFSSNWLLLDSIVGYVVLIYVVIKMIDEHIKK